MPNITSGPALDHEWSDAEALQQSLHSKRRIVVLNGAGISVNAGSKYIVAR